ncbi:virus redox protein [Penguinpox virus]|uniref:Virus redox protein n=3 Tax=Avipoxvirus TaxID=10260 RepID=A0A068EH37_9POXV|nr:virus redox protein [Penguinpox virus]YP_009046397.1 virus redox protein [Pigeonpox virus]YP_009448088.1 redox protein [Flamingopox virus FGPVKD09]WIK87544.1 virus redox protein [Oriental turtle dovepox virus]AID46673.1 virus redox protein [Pigeonpox virus]AID46904.1 virus redox protein [Penguinpox virus]AUD40273.1 redox protein [Flamingopox virus FGPVKD09]WCL40114.1 virus redox protein [Pigeonpox virus]
MSEYKYDIDPPVRCSNCSNNLIEYLKSDRQLIELMLNNNEYKKNILKQFLIFSRNKTLLTKILDPEIRRVLT